MVNKCKQKKKASASTELSNFCALYPSEVRVSADDDDGGKRLSILRPCLPVPPFQATVKVLDTGNLTSDCICSIGSAWLLHLPFKPPPLLISHFLLTPIAQKVAPVCLIMTAAGAHENAILVETMGCIGGWRDETTEGFRNATLISVLFFLLFFLLMHLHPSSTKSPNWMPACWQWNTPPQMYVP